MSSASQYEFDFPENKLDIASENLQQQFADPKGENKQKEEQQRGEPALELSPPEDPYLKELREVSNEIKASKDAQKQLDFKYDKGLGNNGLEM